MNRCQLRVLLSFGISLAVLAASGAAGALILAPSVIGVAIVLIAHGLIMGILATAFAVQWINCTRR